jgi:hypothetical protein
VRGRGVRSLWRIRLGEAEADANQGDSGLGEGYWGALLLCQGSEVLGSWSEVY